MVSKCTCKCQAKTFYIAGSGDYTINFKWRLFFPSAFESNEHGEARFELSDQAYGLEGHDYLARFTGGKGYNQDTGWQDFSVMVNLSGPDNYTIEIGGWNDRKTAANEYVDVYVDEVKIYDVDAGNPFGESRFYIDDSEDEIPTYGGIFRGRPKTFDVQLTAPLTTGHYELQFQMVRELVAWFGETLDVEIEIVFRGDFDRDGDVDQDDFAHFQACLSASGVAQDDPACQDAILDGDTDVDQGDFAVFQACMSGANVPPDPNCGT